MSGGVQPGKSGSATDSTLYDPLLSPMSSSRPESAPTQKSLSPLTTTTRTSERVWHQCSAQRYSAADRPAHALRDSGRLNVIAATPCSTSSRILVKSVGFIV